MLALKDKILSKFIPLIALSLMLIVGVQAQETDNFIVKGVTGNDVLLDRGWDRGCIPGTNGNNWTDATRELIGLELTFTLVDYQNDSETPDCKNGRVGMATFSMILTDDEVLVPITWVDFMGNPADAPDGLEDITEANGASALMTSATITPETQIRANQLNQAMFCGFDDWEEGVGKDAVECLTGGFNPFKGTVIVDDRTLPWRIYDGVGGMFDDNGYPIDIPNYLPHQGPFESHPRFTDFVVQGVSGNDVLLDRIWDRGCIPGTNGNDWTDASRELIGLELSFTLIDFQNGSETPDCENGRVGMATFSMTLTDDEVLVPITWVDFMGNPADAPDGLEDITEANGATALMTSATITPETQVRVDQLNQATFCGFDNWEEGVGKDAIECLTGGFNPFKGTVIVDDRTLPWKIYDGVGGMFDDNGYPIDMPNYLPHMGPFETLKRENS